MRILALTLASCAAIYAAAPVPRPAPEFKIVEPSGKEIPLSSFKGKVVVCGFFATTCPHCQVEAMLFTKLYKEMGARGLQMAAVAFNDNAAILVPGFVQQFQIPYPMGASNWDTVAAFLGHSLMDRFVYPQVAVIDRKGMIRAQTPPMGDPKLQDENYLRSLLDALLKEGAAPAPGSKKPVSKASGSKTGDKTPAKTGDKTN
jgi:peroxiredoxin